nr:ATP-binding cassette domain-containing protein [Thermotogota bacterium]
SDSIENNVALSESVDHRQLKQAFEKSSVDFLSGEHTVKTQLDKKGQPLSGGQQKRINLARAFYHDSDVLILDEPTASLDKETKSKVLEAIKKEKEKRPIILITHDRETYAICDRML